MRIRFPFLVLGVALATGALADDLPAGTRSVLTRESVPESSVSIVVRDAASTLNEQLREFIRAQVPEARDVAVGNLAPLTAGNARSAWSFAPYGPDGRWSRAC
jgi:hypothetical protein